MIAIALAPLQVYDYDPRQVFTGLLNKDGQPIIKIAQPEPIGFTVLREVADEVVE